MNKTKDVTIQWNSFRLFFFAINCNITTEGNILKSAIRGERHFHIICEDGVKIFNVFYILSLTPRLSILEDAQFSAETLSSISVR